MADIPNDGNVTLAVIDGKLNTIIHRLDSVCRSVDDHEQRLRVDERWVAVSQRNWDRHGGDHDDEWEAHNNVHALERSVTGGIGALITAVLSYFQLKS